MRFYTASKSAPHVGGMRKGYVGEIELFGVYCQDNNRCYLVPIADAAKFEAVLRIDPIKIKKVVNMRYAKDFEL
jgi:hypothetical protein